MHEPKSVAPEAAPHRNAAEGPKYAAKKLRHRHCGSGVRAARVRECRDCDIPGSVGGRRRPHPAEGSSQAEGPQDHQPRAQTAPQTEVTPVAGFGPRTRRRATPAKRTGEPGRKAGLSACSAAADPRGGAAAGPSRRLAGRPLAPARPQALRSRPRDRRPSSGHAGRADRRRGCRSPGRFGGRPRQPGCPPAGRPWRARTIR